MEPVHGVRYFWGRWDVVDGSEAFWLTWAWEAEDIHLMGGTQVLSWHGTSLDNQLMALNGGRNPWGKFEAGRGYWAPTHWHVKQALAVFLLGQEDRLDAMQSMSTVRDPESVSAFWNNREPPQAPWEVAEAGQLRIPFERAARQA